MIADLSMVLLFVAWIAWLNSDLAASLHAEADRKRKAKP